MTAPDPRLEEIEGRLSKATPGPWAHAQGVTPYVAKRDWVEVPNHATICVEVRPADAEFLAHSPTDVAYLLAELRKAQDKLGRVASHINARTEYVQAARRMTGDDIEADYWRYQGHMEARRQLAQDLGYTVPYEPGEKTAAVADATGGERG